MSRLKILYFYGKEPYRLNGDLFDNNELYKLGERLRKQLADFTDEINEENGHIAIYVSHHNPIDGGFHCEIRVENISDNLRKKMLDAEVL